MILEIPNFALSISYWLHMLATILWIGGLATVGWFAIPAIQAMKDPLEQVKAFDRMQRRIDPLGWFSMVLLIGTGLVQMAANPNYDGFLAFTNRWAVAILLKHVVFLGMAGLSAYLTWGVTPAFRRGIMLQERGVDAPDLRALEQKNLRLIRVNLVMGLIVLGFTALARAAI